MFENLMRELGRGMIKGGRGVGAVKVFPWFSCCFLLQGLEIFLSVFQSRLCLFCPERRQLSAGYFLAEILQNLTLCHSFSPPIFC